MGKIPNRREKASFLKENIIPIEQSGHLNFIIKKRNHLIILILVC